MLDLFIGLKRVIKRRIVHIDNTVFRLHWLFTSIILISCSLIVTSRQYVGDPIDCLQTDNIAVNILNTYCWIHSTYAIPAAFEKIVGLEVAHPGIESNINFDTEFTKSSFDLNNQDQLDKPVITTTPQTKRYRLYQSNKYRKYYTYYQWVCFALFIQAILFYLPYYIWKLWEGGLLQAITVGMQMAMLPNEEHERKCKILNDYLYSHLKQHKMYAYKYFFCEFLCFTNVTCQFFLTDWLFDGEFFSYGFKVLRYISHDESLKFDPMIYIFPRMTKCIFHTYGFSGDVQRHDALCMLPLNVVNEKIYIFIWFWMVVLLTLLIWVLIYRLITLIFVNSRAHFLKTRCSLSNFSDLNYICQNSNIGDWFLLYMLGSNLDPLIMRDITSEISLKMQHDNKIFLKKNCCSKDENDEEQCSSFLIKNCTKSKLSLKNDSEKSLCDCKLFNSQALCQHIDIEFNSVKSKAFSAKNCNKKIKQKKSNKNIQSESSIDEATFTNYSGIAEECQNKMKYSSDQIEKNLDNENSNELISSLVHPTIDSNASTLPIDETGSKQCHNKLNKHSKPKRKFYRETFGHRNWKRSSISR